MKNYINYIKSAFFLGLMVMLVGCETTPDISDVSRITYFPTFTYDGPQEAIIECNSDFQITPVTASEDGVDLPVTTTVEGIWGPVPSVDITKANNYIETSTAFNSDGFAGTTTREFWVACTGDLVNSIEGLYRSTVLRNGTNDARYVDMEYILIRKIGDNEYDVSNADGGWYQFGRNLGPGYSSPGATITAVDIPSNSFTFGPGIPVRTFGGTITLTDLTVDPAAKVVVMTSYWDFEYTFVATMVQVAL